MYISRENPDFKEKLLTEDILSCISRVFEAFPSDCEVLKQGVMLLGTLAEGYPLVTYQCIVEEIHLSLLHVLREFKRFVSLVQVTIETLGKINGKIILFSDFFYMDYGGRKNKKLYKTADSEPKNSYSYSCC